MRASAHRLAAPAADAPAATRPLVAIAGNPNSGKTTLFNALTGARAKVGNYPGVTVERRTGTLAFPSGRRAEVIDIPGTYSLSARSPEEQIAVDGVLPPRGRSPSAIVAVVDATTLERSLYFALQLVDTGVPTVLALNMMDEARAGGLRIDTEELAKRLAVPVVPLTASKGEGKTELIAALGRLLESPVAVREPEPVDRALRDDVASLEEVLERLHPGEPPAALRARALWSLLSLGDDELANVPAEVREVASAIRSGAERAGRDVDHEIIARRYARIDGIVHGVLHRPGVTPRSWTDRIDGVLTHRVLGVIVFAIVMALLFQALFAWAEPVMDGIGWLVQQAQRGVSLALPAGPLRDLLSNGIIAGVGNVIAFVPQIALLFLFIGVMEDSGYLARVAFLIDRVMKGVGLHGRAFVPLLSGFACAVPAVMATRTIEGRRDRLVTMLALPLMSCSARLPVYALVIAAVFPARARVLGVLTVGGLVLLAMYALSVTATLAAAATLRRTVLRGPTPALVLELPPYRMPVLRNVVLGVWQRVRSFLVDAGTVILAITVVLWALLSFPKDERVHARFERRRAEITDVGEAREASLAAIDAAEAQEQLRDSFAGMAGRAMEPAIRPLGFDWKIGVGLVGSFAAREVLVSTLGIVYGIGEADAESRPLRGALVAARHPDGSRVFTPLAGVSLMVFFVLACQCMSTLAVVRRESGSWRWPLLMLGYMTVLAYAGSLLVYQVGRLLGWGLS